MGIISIRQLNKSYQMGEESLHVLKDIDMTVDEGEHLTILGPSGSGKTTLMNIVGCMDTSDSGSYSLFGLSISDLKDEQLAIVRNRMIGFIFQKYQLIPQYNALQNVIMPLLLRGMGRKEAERTAEESMDMVGLLDRKSHRPNELSGGQQQRVAIARALVTRPKLLLADEPTGALDSVTGREILTLFQQLNEAGNTIIVITHDLNVAEMGRRIVEIQDGQLVSDTSVDSHKNRQVV